LNSESLSKIIEDRLNNQFNQLSKQFFSQTEETTSKFFILDNLLPENITLDIYNNFPDKNSYHLNNTFREKKFTFKQLDTLENSLIGDVTSAFQMDNVKESIERITKTINLGNDPSLYASGLSRMDVGHFLNPHIDNSHDANRKRYRKFNLLFYVTPDVKESDGGNFELWNKDVTAPLKIPAIFNRLIVLETTKDSWHSVDPILSNIHRCCVSNYYFSEDSQESYQYYHVTSFLGRPDEKITRLYSVIDNSLRNAFSKITGFSRGKKRIRTKKPS
jgi:Rps23 Pro-64 3,4-dihydroxylase Tpa1-like proline 4-hydroxylase